MSHQNKTGGMLMTAEEELAEIKELLDEVYMEHAAAGPFKAGTEEAADRKYRMGWLEGRAYELTRDMDEHPDWWNDYVCSCHECATCC